MSTSASRKSPLPLEPYEIDTYAAILADDLRAQGPASRQAVLHQLRHRLGLLPAEAEGVLARALAGGWLEALEGDRFRAGPPKARTLVPWGNCTAKGYRPGKP